MCGDLEEVAVCVSGCECMDGDRLERGKGQAAGGRLDRGRWGACLYLFGVVCGFVGLYVKRCVLNDGGHV